MGKTWTATACYRELGAELRKHRKAAGLSETRLARQLGWSHSWISRIETGHAAPNEIQVIQYLAWCGVYGIHTRDLCAMAREAQQKLGYWVRPHGAGLPEAAYSLIYHETTASASTSYEPQFIPGLLQTEAYIRAMACEQLPDSDIESTVRTRQERQRVLHRLEPARFTFFLHEQALRLEGADPETMHEQLLALLLVDGLAHVFIRVVPASAATVVQFGGAFRLLEFRNHQPLVYLDGLFAGLFLEDREYVDSYRTLIPAIADIALTERQSREYLANRASAYDRERADPDVFDRVEEKQP